MMITLLMATATVASALGTATTVLHTMRWTEAPQPYEGSGWGSLAVAQAAIWAATGAGAIAVLSGWAYEDLIVPRAALLAVLHLAFTGAALAGHNREQEIGNQLQGDPIAYLRSGPDTMQLRTDDPQRRGLNRCITLGIVLGTGMGWAVAASDGDPTTLAVPAVSAGCSGGIALTVLRAMHHWSAACKRPRPDESPAPQD